MIRVHVLQVRYMPNAQGTGVPRYVNLRIDLSLCPERIDNVQNVDKMLRENAALPEGTRAIVRYDDQETGFRLYAVSDTRDSVERARESYYRRVYGNGGEEKSVVPDYMPEDL